jgi:hypothetical protein
MVNEENQTILDRLNAAWGLVQEVNNKYEKAEKLVFKNKQVDQAKALLQLAIVDLTNAYRLCLYRRNKRYLLNFRTLEIFPKKVEEINSLTASLEAQIQTFKEQIQEITKEEALNIEKKMKKTSDKDRKLLFTWAKKVVDYLEDVPNLEDPEQMVDFLKSRRDFKELSFEPEPSAEIKTFWNRVVESFPIGKVVIHGEKFDNLPSLQWSRISFVDCRFNFRKESQYLMGGTFGKCDFSANIDNIIHPESCNFYKCKFERMIIISSPTDHSSYKDCYFNEVIGTVEGCRFISNFEDCKFNNLRGAFSFSGGLIKNCSFNGNSGLINLYFGPIRATHYPQTIEDLTFRKLSIKKGDVMVSFYRSNIGGKEFIKNIKVDASSFSKFSIEQTSGISGLELSSSSFINLWLDTGWNYIKNLRMKGNSVTDKLTLSSQIEEGLIKGCTFNKIEWNCLGSGYYIKNVRIINTVLNPYRWRGTYIFQGCLFDDVVFKGGWENAEFNDCKFEDCDTREAHRLDVTRKA